MIAVIPPPDWITHRRDEDGELLGYLRPAEGESDRFVPVAVFGSSLGVRPSTADRGFTDAVCHTGPSRPLLRSGAVHPVSPSPERLALLACIGCGAMVPDIAGPTHPYMRASPGCWLRYGELSARHDYGDVARPPVHWHHMDCYAVQHPGGARTERRQRQSVAVHLIALCLFNEHGIPPQQAPGYRRQLSATVLPRMGLAAWPYLEPPTSLGRVTVADVCRAANDDDYEAAVTDWAAAAWQAWALHHTVVSRWAVAALGGGR